MPEEPKEERQKKAPVKLVIGIAIIVAVIILAKILPVQVWLVAFNDWVEGLGYVGYLVFVGMYILATVLFLPGSVLTIGAGFLFGVIGGSVAVSVASTVGASLAFLIGRYIARNRVASRLSKNEKFAAVDSAIGKEGGKIVLLLRLSPVFPFNALNYLLGLTAVKFWHYVIGSWLGMMPGTVLYVYLGHIGKAGLEAASGGGGKTPLEYAFLGFGLVITAIVTVYITKVARKALRGAELEGASENPPGTASSQ